MIRFDGLYVGPPRQNQGDPAVFFDYLRFYENGSVINCVSSGTPEQVIRWFHKDNPSQVGLLRDRYTVQGDHITFSPAFRDMDEGEEMLIKVDYSGQIKEGGEILELIVGDQMNNSSNPAQTYHFARVQ
jgi:hypothetical protein